MLALLLFLPVLVQEIRPTSAPAPVLELVTVLDTAAPRSEIVAVQARTARAVLTHAKAGTVELFDLADPARPRPVRVIELALAKGEELTSVALPAEGDWLIAAVKAAEPLAPGRAVVHALADGKLVATFPCGVGPDAVTIAPSGTQALVANEAEGYAEVEGKLVSAPGSVTWIRFAPELARSEVVQLGIELATDAPLDGRLLEREVGKDDRELPLGSTPEHLEPEYAVFLPGETRALVTLQESNLVAYFDLEARTLERLVALGTTEHAADLTADGSYAEAEILHARREPDGIALTPDGRHFLTADEGDTVPGPKKTPAGTPTGGGRTLSVFDVATGALRGDTGPQLDRAAAATGLYPDDRSEKKGSEPEMVVSFERAGVPYAAVTLERAGALALVDLSDPTKPTVVAVTACGKDPHADEPEGLAHYRAADGTDWLYVANEGTGTLGVLRVTATK
jgi:DNA-binding beta-propeller fold protein YncE